MSENNNVFPESEQHDCNEKTEKQSCFWTKLTLGARIGMVAGAVLVIAAVVVGCILLFGGSGNRLSSDSLYVSKVENMPDDFIMGMDASAVPSLEASGVKYYDHDGNEKDVYEILAENGVNYIRVRIWNDPFDKDGNGYGGGNCDIENAVEIGKRATKYGMKLLVNFHYSDFWADPAKQQAPKEWAGLPVNIKADRLYEYTVECLERLVAEGVDIGMVQIGNETTGQMCGESRWADIAALMKRGSEAVRQVCPDALVAIHFTNPEKVTNYESYSANLNYYGVDYDVFASSYYPAWHGTLENLTEVLNKVADNYGKKTMIIETAYPNTTEDTDFYTNGGLDGTKLYPFSEQGQANHIRELTDTAVNKMHNCIGICYWEGTWISVGGETWEENSILWEKYGSGWASSYAGEYDPNDAGQWYGGCSVDNQAFFDQNGKARESLKVFALVRYGNEIKITAEAIEDVNLMLDINGEITLPSKVNAVMTDNSKQAVDVVWHNVDYDAMKNNGPAKYTIKGTAAGMEAYCYVSMVEYNYVKNWSFEDDLSGTGWTATYPKKLNELKVMDKVSDSLTGNRHYHFWDASGVEFNLEQEITGLKSGKYKYGLSTMGGDMGSYTAYAYVKINGEIVARKDATFTEWDVWHTTDFIEINYTEGDTIVVGIYVKAEAGAWGSIDDVMLNSIKE